MKQKESFMIYPLVEQQMFGGRDLPFDAAQHMGYAHLVIVHNVGQMIGGK